MTTTELTPATLTDAQVQYITELLEDEVDKYDLQVFGAEQDMQHKYERIRERGARKLPNAQAALQNARFTLACFKAHVAQEGATR